MPTVLLHLEALGGGELSVDREGNKSYPTAEDRHDVSPVSLPGCSSQGNTVITATVKAFNIDHRDAAPLRVDYLKWVEKDEKCDPVCRDAVTVRMSRHIALSDDVSEPAWWNNPAIIVDQGTFTFDTRWSCCNRPVTNWQTVDFPMMQLYWHGGAPGVVTPIPK